MRALLVLVLAFAAAPAWSQGAKIVPATPRQFTGYWRVVLIPDAIHKSAIKNATTGYDHPCQFFIHERSGQWRSLTIDPPADAKEAWCPSRKAELAPAIAAGSANHRWAKLSQQDGVYEVTNLVTRNALTWKADYVLEDIPADNRLGVPIRRGEMILQAARMLPDNKYKPVWPVILRPVPD